MTMTAKKKKILFWSVLMLAIILRCIRFGSVPDGINQDEAMGAMDAWALSKYGTDRYGTFLPVHFEAWKYGQMSVLLAYCMVPFIKLFGFNAITVRLPMLVVSCGAVALVYLIAEKLFDERIAFIIFRYLYLVIFHRCGKNISGCNNFKKNRCKYSKIKKKSRNPMGLPALFHPE